MFLPKLTPEANRALRQDRNFVKSQLKHYGLQYDEREFTGNGVKLLKKALEAGKFDSVPPSILELEQQLRRESISTRTLGELVEWTPNGSDELVNFYFLDSANKPDKTKMPDGLAVPLPRRSEYHASLLAKAIRKVSGLMSKREADTMLIAWHEGGIAKAREAGQAAAREAAEARKRKDQALVQSRTDRHENYLHSLDSKANSLDPSPVGRYLLHCESIENEWPDTKKVDMTLDIRLSRQTRIYEASFNIGVAEGPMKLITDQDALDQYLADSEGDEDGESDEDGGSDEDEQGDEDEESSGDETSELEEDDRTSGIATESAPTTTTAQKRIGSTFASETSKSQSPRRRNDSTSTPPTRVARQARA